MSRNDWPTILAESASFTRRFAPVTLRQVFYHLVSLVLIPNTRSAYNALSNRTARLREENLHPQFIDSTRQVFAPYPYSSIRDGVLAQLDDIELDRTAGQPERIAVICEKRGHAGMLYRAIGGYHWPVVESGGNPSVTIRVATHAYDIDTVLYVGDYDPSGVNIERIWNKDFPHVNFHRVALTLDQIADFGFEKLPGKMSDANAPRFIRQHGELFQVECDAIRPDVLRQMVLDAITSRMDLPTFHAVLDEEEGQRHEIRRLLGGDAA